MVRQKKTLPDLPHSMFAGQFCLAVAGAGESSLYAQQVSQLQLDAELVCMSTCWSGSGKLQRERSIGLVWTFLAAGARTTLATYWPLADSDLTVRLVQKLYQQVVEEGSSKAHALQRALQIAIREAPERPDLWGAFFLSGLS